MPPHNFPWSSRDERQILLWVSTAFSSSKAFCNQAQEDYQKPFPDQPIPQWSSKLSYRYVMTIMVFIYDSRGFQNFKSFYSMYICSPRQFFAKG